VYIKKKDMKKLLLILSIVLVSCSGTKPTQDNDPQVDEPRIMSNENSSRISFRFIILKGHEYIIMDGDQSGGICHSESCYCTFK
jgi:hypothetical protein